MAFVILFLVVVGGVFFLLKAAGYEIRADGSGGPVTGDMFSVTDPDYFVLGPGSSDW